MVDNVLIGPKVRAAVTDQQFLIFDDKNGKLYYDADGNGAGTIVLIAGVKGKFTGIDYTSFEVYETPAG